MMFCIDILYIPLYIFVPHPPALTTSNMGKIKMGTVCQLVSACVLVCCEIKFPKIKLRYDTRQLLMTSFPSDEIMTVVD